MNYEDYCELYEKINARVRDRTVALAILAELGKDARTPKDRHKEPKPLATDKQIALLKKLKISHSSLTTKEQASELIEAALHKKK